MSEPFPPTALQRRHGHMVRDSTSSYKIVIVIKNFLNPEGHQNPTSAPVHQCSGSKVTALLLLVELHREGFASAACAAGLFFLRQDKTRQERPVQGVESLHIEEVGHCAVPLPPSWVRGSVFD